MYNGRSRTVMSGITNSKCISNFLDEAKLITSEINETQFYLIVFACTCQILSTMKTIAMRKFTSMSFISKS